MRVQPREVTARYFVALESFQRQQSMRSLIVALSSRVGTQHQQAPVVSSIGIDSPICCGP
jgi:hypothetical protein